MGFNFKEFLFGGDPDSVDSTAGDAIKNTVATGKGLTPQQRNIFTGEAIKGASDVGNRLAGSYTKSAAAQGIGGSGLAQAGISNIGSDVLEAGQQGIAKVNEIDFKSYQDALKSLLEREREERLRKSQQKGLLSVVGDIAGSYAGKKLGLKQDTK